MKGAPEGNENAKKQRPQNDVVVSDKPKTNQTAHRIGKAHGVSRAQVERSERYANAVDKLDKDGVVRKEDILSGKVKVPASKVVAASKAATPEEAKAVLATKLVPHYAEMAKERKAAGKGSDGSGGRGNKKTLSPTGDKVSSKRASEEAADAVGVGPRTVQKAQAEPNRPSHRHVARCEQPACSPKPDR